MEFAICLLSVIPVRSEPSHRSAMVTQVLFGELFRIVEKDRSWYRVSLSFDGYEGWVDSRQSTLVSEQEYLRLNGSVTAVTLDLVELLSNETGKTMIPLMVGSSLPGLDESRIRVGQEVFFYDGLVSTATLSGQPEGRPDKAGTRRQLTEDAMLYFGAPYLWGGRSPFGLDCSGFVQMVYKLQGIKLRRDASQQAGEGEPVSLLVEALPGDLAFFDDEEGRITHVGILLDPHRIMHCSGQVKVDTVDHEGIFCSTLQKYTHKLRLIRRILPS